MTVWAMTVLRTLHAHQAQPAVLCRRTNGPVLTGNSAGARVDASRKRCGSRLWRPTERGEDMANNLANDVSLRVARGSQVTTDTAQSVGALRVVGIGEVDGPATRIWLGKRSNKPGHPLGRPPSRGGRDSRLRAEGRCADLLRAGLP